MPNVPINRNKKKRLVSNNVTKPSFKGIGWGSLLYTNWQFKGNKEYYLYINK